MTKPKVYSTKYINAFSWFHYPLYGTIARLMISRKNFLIQPEDIKAGKKYVFAVNHQGIPDFFVVFFGMPTYVHSRLTPYRFFIANRFFRNRFLRWILLSFGGFPAKKHRTLEWGLPAAEHAIRRGESVVIFPEGKVSLIDRVHTPKRGVEFLANEKNAMIIPVRVRWHRAQGYFNSYDLVVGKPFNGHGMKAVEIMDRVYSLKF